jgi:hypothetical protein
MYSLYSMYCDPPGHQGVTRGLNQQSAHQGAKVGTGGVVDRIWKEVESVWNDTVSAEVARLCTRTP